MASKWKYANVSAGQRLKMLRDGNHELLDEEVDRTKEIVRARRELGLDTKEQEDWIDTVGYNYSLSKAKDGQKINRSGYAALYLGDSKNDSEPSPVKAYRDGKPETNGTYITNAKRKIASARKLALESAEKKYDAAKQEAARKMYEKYPFLKEELVNSGASLEGGKATKVRAQLRSELEDIYAGLDSELENKRKSIDEKYDGLVGELMKYRKEGTAKESLGVIADVLVKNAALEDDFDAFAIVGVGDSDDKQKQGNVKSENNNGKIPAAAFEKAGGEAEKADKSEVITENTADVSGVLPTDVSAEDAGKVLEAFIKLLSAGSITGSAAPDAAARLMALFAADAAKKNK